MSKSGQEESRILGLQVKLDENDKEIINLVGVIAGLRSQVNKEQDAFTNSNKIVICRDAHIVELERQIGKLKTDLFVFNDKDGISREEYAELALINEMLRLKIDELSTALTKEQKAFTESSRINGKRKETIIMKEKQIERLSNSTSLTHEIKELTEAVCHTKDESDSRIRSAGVEIANLKYKLNQSDKVINSQSTKIAELDIQIKQLETDLHHIREDGEIAITEAMESTENTNFRTKLPSTRKSVTHKFFINGHEGYMTVGLFEDGTPGELFIRMAKEGSTIGGLMDAIGILTSMCLQHGMTVEKLREKFEHGRFEPSGFTHCEEIGNASSITDYIFRWMDLNFIEGRV